MNKIQTASAIRVILALLAVAVFVAACGRIKTAVCPRVAVLNHASSVTKFAGGERDEPANALYRLEMTDISMTCKYGGSGLEELEANVKVTVTALRGPKYQGGIGRVVYFVVVTDRSGAVLAKRTFPIRFDLRGRPEINFTEGSWMFVDLAARGGGGGAGFEIWTGFQLSDAELAYNRRRLGL
ncbi:MAG: hypothetical protein O7I42_06500 [Alphaproteobacteria bacterium]|nr:hypothetical protein [Alphaproteobacteria bacterium]